jgi:hypothetical protein
VQEGGVAALSPSAVTGPTTYRRRRPEPDEATAMHAWAHGGGFSRDASVRIEAHDRPGLERRLRCCARPAFALERLRELAAEHLLYDSAKPGPRGALTLRRSPLESRDRLAALIPPARRHRHRYFGCWRGMRRSRAAVAAPAATGVASPETRTPAAAVPAPAASSASASAAPARQAPYRRAARYARALLLARGLPLCDPPAAAPGA